MDFLNEYILPHWPFIGFALVVSVVAQVLKSRILTKEVARESRVVFQLRRCLPLILILLGALLGVFWPGETSPGIDGTMAKSLYFMVSVCTAIAGFNVFKTWVKNFISSSI